MSSSTRCGKRNEGLEAQVVLEAQEVEEPMKSIHCHHCMKALGFQDSIPHYTIPFTLCVGCAGESYGISPSMDVS